MTFPSNGAESAPDTKSDTLSYLHPTYSNPHNKRPEVRSAEAERLDHTCPLCLERDPERQTTGHMRSGGAWVVDHDHGTGKVRGMVCARCNRAMQDGIRPDHLRRMADYLDHHNAHGLATRIVPARPGRPKGRVAADPGVALDERSRYLNHRNHFPDQYSAEELAMDDETFSRHMAALRM